MTPAAGPARARLRVLGAIDLQGAGIAAARVLAQPRRLALLVYLALRLPRGAHRRDEVMAVFWPESSDARARAALRQALRFLRRWLGENAIPARETGSIGIARDALEVDALEFEQALEHGDARGALDLYRGDLLPAFHVAGAPAFERWLEGERSRLRTLARDACTGLADAAERSGDAAGTARWTMRLLEIEPADERAARRLDAIQARARLQLDERRVLVLSLADRTRDRGAGVLGGMAADWIARELSRVPGLDVVPPMIAHGAARRTSTDADAPEALAAEHHAAILVDGAVYSSGADVRFEARITDVAARRLLRGPEPIVAPPTDPIPALDELADRLAACLAPSIDPLAAHVRQSLRPPAFETYRAYMEGLDRFIAGDWDAALEHFRRAADADPEYALPRIVSAIVHWNRAELHEAKAVAGAAERSRAPLSRFDRAVLDMVLAWLRGDWAAALEACRRQAAMAPGTIPNFQIAQDARRLNRPREARDTLLALDPDRGELRGWIFYWVELANAYHLLGEHGAERAAARRASERHPGHRLAALLEVRALAATGRLDELDRVLEQSLASPGTHQPDPGMLLHEAALELAAHGHPADAYHARAVEWYESLGPGADEQRARARARALYHAGHLDAARARFETLVDAPGRNPLQLVGHHHQHLQGHVDEGYLAAIAVRTGDAHAAATWCERIETLDRPFLYGAREYWLAILAALADDAPRAIHLLRRAFAEGLPFEMSVHTEPHLARLAGEPLFDMLMRPRG